MDRERREQSTNTRSGSCRATLFNPRRREGLGAFGTFQQISRDVLQVQQGSLYPALHRLENRGLLAAEWKDSETGREAKFYRLTAKGQTELKNETESWKQLAKAVRLILESSEANG